MGRKIWLISDTHFGHENIIKYCNRPFSSVYDMDETIKKNWNSTVGTSDIVYHLGDLYFGKGFESSGRSPVEFLKSLNGHKRLVLGNHDNALDQVIHKCFEKVVSYRIFPEFSAILSHVPLNEISIKQGYNNYHGHIHNRESPKGPYKNMSVEAISYVPHLLGVTKSD